MAALALACAASFGAGTTVLAMITWIDLGVLGRISDTALTRDSAIVFAENGLPNTFVTPAAI